MMGKSFVRVCKKGVVAYFKVLNWHLVGETEDNHSNSSKNQTKSLLKTNRQHYYCTVLHCKHNLIKLMLK